MNDGYRLADGLVLPPNAVTQTFAILAKRGAGKTYTASVLVEEFAKVGAQFIVVDPVGVWWGMRYAADGKGPGFPVAIIGGEHGDMPLTEDSGEAVANIAVSMGTSLILDLSLLRKGAQRRFMTAFCEGLYFKNRYALHLVIDEADLYAPQRTVPGIEPLLGAIEDIVRRGRARGLGVTLISQRPASLNKEVLTQAEVLIALRLTSKWDRAAIDAWVQAHGSDEERGQLMSSLASLPIGEGWIWSPGWLKEFRRIKVRQRETFDSSATPEVGVTAPTPTGQASVNLERIRALLATGGPVSATSDTTAPTQQSKNETSRTAQLERKLKELEARLREAETRPSTQVIADPVDRQAVSKALATIGEAVQVIEKALSTEPAAKPSQPAAALLQPTAESGDLRAGERRILEVLRVRHPLTMTRQQVATLARLRPSSGTFNTYWGHLKRSGLLNESDNEVSLTDAGFAAIGGDRPGAPNSPEEVRAMWRSALRAGEVRMLDVLLEARPSWIDRTDLAAQAGLEPTSGTFNTYLGTLRRNGLAEVSGGQVRASDVFDLVAHREAMLDA